ncbi:ankyrin repeat-containing domain protein [Trichoderma austrokoningii]
MEAVLKNKMDKVKRDAWRLQFGDSEIQVSAILPIFASIASKANGYISTALTANPPASLAWAGISVLLPLFFNPSEHAGSLAKGLDYISTLIVRGQLREGLYTRRYELAQMTDGCQSSKLDHLAYRRALEVQYRKILRLQAETYCHFAKNAAYRLGLDAVKWNDWEAMINDVRLQEDALAALDNLWYDVQYSQDSLAVKKQHQESLAAWLSIGEDVSSLRKALVEAEQNHDRAGLLSWLCQVDPSQMYNAARDKHELGTSEWLLKNHEFLAWEKEESSLMWLHGKAGSGKSILSSSVIKYLDDKYASDPLTAVAYFYFSFTDSEKQVVDVMLASIIKQILASRPNIPLSAQKLKEYKGSGRRPDTQTLTAALRDAISGFSAVYITVDALDECPTLNGERKKLLRVLSAILDKAPDNLHLLFTSRKESDIGTAMQRHSSRSCSYELDLLSYRITIENDIGIYIDTILATDDYESWPASVKTEAKNSLVNKADGMFQYVRCQFDALQNLSTVAEVHEALQSLPDGLSATYDRMLLSINPNFQSRVMTSLKWLAFSLTPIDVEQLSEIFTFRPGHTLPVDGTEKLFRASDILKYFSSLVVVAGSEVRLAHFSIKEYLTSTQITGGPAAAFGFTEIDAHLHIARSCLAHHFLHADDKVFDIQANAYSTQMNDLARYTSVQWAWHLEMVPRKLWPSEIVQKAASALDARSKTLAKMIALDSFLYRQGGLFLSRPLCYTAWLGLSNLTMMQLSSGPGTNNFFTQGDLDAALADAAYNGCIELVWRLIDEGADVNAKEDFVDTSKRCMRSFDGHKDYGSALQAAVLGGQLEIVKILVNKGAEINANHGIIGSALHAAASKDDLDIVKFLTSCGADIHSRSGNNGSVLAASLHFHQDQCFHFLLSKGALRTDDGETALIKAASVDRWDLCHLMLDQGASIHACAPEFMYGSSPLQAACKNLLLDRGGKGLPNKVEFIDRLLDLGVDINALGGGESALQAACRAGDIRLVKIFLDKAADVNATNKHNQNALQSLLFCNGDKLDIMKLLLSKGANVNGQSSGASILRLACQLRCSKDEISLLLEHGADVHAQHEHYGTVLQAAVTREDEWLVRELLERGVDVNEQVGRNETALQAAYSLSNSELAQDMVKLLLEHGADVHLKGGPHGSAFNAAAANLQLSNRSLQQLLDLGVDINECDEERRGTTLQVVFENYADNVDRTKLLERLQFLFERGADVNIAAGRFGFALQSAFMFKYRKNIRAYLYENAGLVFLLDNYPDINVNAEGGEYGSALQAAAYVGETESVKLLIQKGANVNAQGGEYKNALNAATVWGYWDIAQILLDNGAEPDCYRSESPDEEWLRSMVEKCGRGARERYERIWKMKHPSLEVAK